MAKKTASPLASKPAPAPVNQEELANSLSQLAGTLTGTGFANGPAGGAQVSNPQTLYLNLRNYLISNQRILLNNLYVEFGVVQSLVDLPVDDGFSRGFEIKTGQLDADEIEELKIFWEQEGIGDELIQAVKWARLFGGASLLIMTDQKSDTVLDIEKITEDTPLKFRAVDMWEMYDQKYVGTDESTSVLDPHAPLFSYYGVHVDASRIMTIRGKAAPSFTRRQLRGWGMSELERVVRSLNQFVKNQDVIFELMDEAKVDVYGIENLNSSLLSSKGTAGVASRVQQANIIKSFVNALVMDKEDTYEQKTMAFTGLAEMLHEIRIGLAADLRMPVTKLFGISSAGFSSGEDDIENYNAMIESQVRAKVKFHIVKLLKICCRKKFGFAPDDLMISWPSLRILDAKDEEAVKDSQFGRVTTAWQLGLADDEETKAGINKASLLPHEIDASVPALDRGTGDDEEEGSDEGVAPFKVGHEKTK